MLLPPLSGFLGMGKSRSSLHCYGSTYIEIMNVDLDPDPEFWPPKLDPDQGLPVCYQFEGKH